MTKTFPINITNETLPKDPIPTHTVFLLFSHITVFMASYFCHKNAYLNYESARERVTPRRLTLFVWILIG